MTDKKEKTELEKYAEISDAYGSIAEFLEWMSWSPDYYLGSKKRAGWSIEQVLYEYFEIDGVQLEKERRALLEDHRTRTTLDN